MYTLLMCMTLMLLSILVDQKLIDALNQLRWSNALFKSIDVNTAAVIDGFALADLILLLITSQCLSSDGLLIYVIPDLMFLDLWLPGATDK